MRNRLFFATTLIVTLAGSRASAAPIYSVTNLGPARQWDEQVLEYTTDASGRGFVTNSRTGVSSPFQKTFVPIPSFNSRPGRVEVEGKHKGEFTAMVLLQANAHGYVLAAEPIYGIGSTPMLHIGRILKRHADGSHEILTRQNKSYGPVIVFQHHDPFPDAPLYLSNSGQVLSGDLVMYDIHKDEYTMVHDLIPPSSGILASRALDMDDEGRILVKGRTSDWPSYDANYYVLTPPTPIPEPTTLTLFGVVASAFAGPILRALALHKT